MRNAHRRAANGSFGSLAALTGNISLSAAMEGKPVVTGAACWFHKKIKGAKIMYQLIKQNRSQEPWNKGKLVGQKLPLKLQEIWAIRTRLQIEDRHRDLALFNLAIDSKLRACDLLRLRVSDVSNGGRVSSRAMIMQRKTARPVQFEITLRTRTSVSRWIQRINLCSGSYLFPSRVHQSLHLSTRQYARIVESWVAGIGLDPTAYGTHSLRRTKATLIYRQTKNLRAIQLLLGHAKLDSTVRYLGIEIDDALEMAEQIEA
jgi:integrase